MKNLILLLALGASVVPAAAGAAQPADGLKGPTPGASADLSEATWRPLFSDRHVDAPADAPEFGELFATGQFGGSPADDLLFVERRDGVSALVARNAVGLARLWRIPVASDAQISLGDLDGVEGWELATFRVERTSPPPRVLLVRGEQRAQLAVYDAVGGQQRWARTFVAPRIAIEAPGFSFAEHAEDSVHWPTFLPDATGDGIGEVSISQMTTTYTAAVGVSRQARWTILDGRDGSEVRSEAFDTLTETVSPIADVSGDGLADLAVTSYSANEQTWSLRTITDPTPLWSVTLPISGGGAIEARQLDGVGRTDLLLLNHGDNVRDPMIYALRGEDGTVLWSQPWPGFFAGRTAVLVDDRNGDGGSDLLDLPWEGRSGRLLLRSGATGAILWERTLPEGDGIDFSFQGMANLDDDAHDEVLLGRRRSVPIGPMGSSGLIGIAPTISSELVAVDHDGTVRWQRDVTDTIGFAPTLLAHDVAGGPGVDLARTVEYSSLTLQIEVLDGATGELAWTSGELAGTVTTADALRSGSFTGTIPQLSAIEHEDAARFVAVYDPAGLRARARYL